jgi:N-acetylglutamate synthase-like GNAT family acetyltransferase
MQDSLRIAALSDLPAGLDDLCAEASREGFMFMEKFVREWRSGANRFAQPGEVLLGAFSPAGLIGVGGLNRDPYTDQDGVGRVRHLYVTGTARRSGVGSVLVHRLLAHAVDVFHSVRLRTDTQAAADFYVGLGFTRVQDSAATHILRLGCRSKPGGGDGSGE